MSSPKRLEDYMACDCDDPIRPLDTYITDDGVMRNIIVCEGCGSMIRIDSQIESVSDIELVATVREEEE